MNINYKAVWEGVKEVGRLALFAALSAAAAWLTDKLSGLDPNSVWVIVGTVILRFWDKYRHKNPAVKSNGIAPF